MSVDINRNCIQNLSVSAVLLIHTLLFNLSNKGYTFMIGNGSINNVPCQYQLPARCAHSMSSVATNIFAFGGLDEESFATNTLFKISAYSIMIYMLLYNYFYLISILFQI